MHRDFAVAVKAVLLRDGKVLVLRRSKDEMAGSYLNKHQKWDFPGGGLHFYERAEDGLRREIREETALSVQIGPPLSMFDIIRHQVHLCIFTYVCYWKQGEVCLRREHDGFVWMTEEETACSELPHWMKRDISRAFAEAKRREDHKA